MSKTNSPYIKFTYTLVGIDGEPEEKSYILNTCFNIRKFNISSKKNIKCKDGK